MDVHEAHVVDVDPRVDEELDMTLMARRRPMTRARTMSHTQVPRRSTTETGTSMDAHPVHTVQQEAPHRPDTTRRNMTVDPDQEAPKEEGTQELNAGV